MSIILSLLAIIIAWLSLYVTFLFQNDDIKIEVQYAIDEVIRYIKYYTWYNKYKKDVNITWEVWEFLITYWPLSRKKYSRFRASTVKRKPSILFIISSVVLTLLLIIEAIVYISELFEKLLQIFL